MFKNFITISAALAVVSIGSLVSNHAQAGGSQSAPTKTSGASQVVAVNQAQVSRQAQTPCFGITCIGITDYSSSSATPAAPTNRTPFKR
jgi:hypothetical protein